MDGAHAGAFFMPKSMGREKLAMIIKGLIFRDIFSKMVEGIKLINGG